jgi:hypothetical protein
MFFSKLGGRILELICEYTLVNFNSIVEVDTVLSPGKNEVCLSKSLDPRNEILSITKVMLANLLDIPNIV